MAEVRSIFGGQLNDNGAYPEVVEELERLIEEARRGDITAIAVAFVDRANVANTAVAGSNGRTASLGGAIGMLFHRFYAQWRDLTDH